MLTESKGILLRSGSLGGGPHSGWPALVARVRSVAGHFGWAPFGARVRSVAARVRLVAAHSGSFGRSSPPAWPRRTLPDALVRSVAWVLAPLGRGHWRWPSKARRSSTRDLLAILSTLRHADGGIGRTAPGSRHPSTDRIFVQEGPPPPAGNRTLTIARLTFRLVHETLGIRGAPSRVSPRGGAVSREAPTRVSRRSPGAWGRRPAYDWLGRSGRPCGMAGRHSHCTR
jgi:hypothetical protein